MHSGFEGLSQLDSRLAGGGNQFTGEPPDQGLCAGQVAGTTDVVETVNNALNVYDGQTRQLLLGPITLAQFYGTAPAINRTTGKFGPFMSDPKCYFDTATQRWFHSILVISTDPNTGAFTTPAYTLLAVSDTSDPLGTYHRYRIPATEPTKTNCPCFGDQPLIGADKYGFYVNTSEYSLGTGHANFAQIYAIDKARWRPVLRRRSCISETSEPARQASSPPPPQTRISPRDMAAPSTSCRALTVSRPIATCAPHPTTRSPCGR